MRPDNFFLQCGLSGGVDKKGVEAFGEKYEAFLTNPKAFGATIKAELIETYIHYAMNKDLSISDIAEKDGLSYDTAYHRIDRVKKSFIKYCLGK